jgi:muramoyltetrapeptide carboxypeptidase
MASQGKISIITPSWTMKKKDEFLSGLCVLENLGLEILNKNLPKKIPSVKAKVKELHNAFLNKKADIILAQRGGYSSMQILPYVNFKIIKRNPKLLAGFSDLCTLLNSIYETTGVVTLHSPMVINFANLTKLSLGSFVNALNGFPQKSLLRGAPIKTYVPGKARGILKGGNLVTLSALFGTRWELDTKNAILFFEDVDEKPHEIDRYLTQWIISGKLNKISGLILGDFRGVKNSDAFKVIQEQMKVKFPVIHCPYIGHVKNNLTLPIGRRVELNTVKKTLELI